MTTIRDVAAAAGVSPSTVSNVLNNRPHVSAGARSRVLHAVETLGYRANTHARQLVTHRSRIVAIELPSPSRNGSPRIPNSSYFLSIVNGATEAAGALQYALVMLPSKSEPSGFRGFGIDGYIVVDPDESCSADSHQQPTVVIGSRSTGGERYGFVDNDHEHALRFSMRHLIERGKRSPAIVLDNTNRPYMQIISQAFDEWSQSHGRVALKYSIDESNLGAVDASLAAMRECGVDAIYACSDELALVLLQRAQRIGLDIPGDLAIVSAVDSLAMTLTTPPVSAIELLPELAGDTAMRILVNILEHGQADESTCILPATLTQRASS